MDRQQKLEEDPEETAYSKLVARQSLEKKIKKLMPGETNGVHTLQVNGELITDKIRIEVELSKYWRKVFTKKTTEAAAKTTQDQWLTDAAHDFHPPEQIDMAKKYAAPSSTPTTLPPAPMASLTRPTELRQS